MQQIRGRISHLIVDNGISFEIGVSGANEGALSATLSWLVGDTAWFLEMLLLLRLRFLSNLFLFGVVKLCLLGSWASLSNLEYTYIMINPNIDAGVTIKITYHWLNASYA